MFLAHTGVFAHHLDRLDVNNDDDDDEGSCGVSVGGVWEEREGMFRGGRKH